MGLLKNPVAAVRLHPVSSSSAPTGSLNHVHHKRHLPRRILVKALGAVLIVSLLGMATAAQSGETNDHKNSSAPSSRSSLELQMQSNSAPDTSSQTNTDTSTSVTVENTPAQHSAHVTVNGRNVPVPANGSHTVTSPDGSVTTTVTNTTEGNSQNFSSTNIDSSFSNSTNVDINQENSAP